MFASLDNLEYSLYAYPESAPQYPKPEPPLINTIEFMDLTAPQHDSRRRRRSNTAQDKEAVSNMRIVSAVPSRIFYLSFFLSSARTHSSPSPPFFSLSFSPLPPSSQTLASCTKSLLSAASSSAKPCLPARLPRTQRKTRAAPGATTRGPRNQAPRPDQILRRPGQHPRPAQAGSQDPAWRTRTPPVIARTLGISVVVVIIAIAIRRHRGTDHEDRDRGRDDLGAF